MSGFIYRLSLLPGRHLSSNQTHDYLGSLAGIIVVSKKFRLSQSTQRLASRGGAEWW